MDGYDVEFWTLTYADAMHWRQALFMLMLRMVSSGGAVVPIF